eukprot:GFYU01002426.1.p1 GENE.GFYU01002426.1~~GFYU01002426.1.p1  ORF type:complete len:376 (-),score=74.26 GFYU01002426.1:266-1393(-)
MDWLKSQVSDGGVIMSVHNGAAAKLGELLSKKAPDKQLALANSISKSPADNCRSALMIAASYGDVETMEVLLGYNADPNLTTDDLEHGRNCSAKHLGETALIFAMKAPKNNLEMTNRLLQYGADPNYEDDDGKTALLVAAMECPDDKVIAALVAGGARVDHVNRGGATALMAATYRCRGEFPVFQALLVAGANPNVLNEKHESVLLRAVNGWNKDTVPMVRSLLEKGANPDVPDSTGMTPLMHAAKNTHDWGNELVKALIHQKAQLQLVDGLHMRSALHWACMTSTKSIFANISTLLQAGADPNPRDKYGDTPITISIRNLSPADQAVVMLMRGGADTTANAQDIDVSKYIAELNRPQGDPNVVGTSYIELQCTD